jgi:hypothetical protein
MKPKTQGTMHCHEPATLENHHHHILYLLGAIKRLEQRLAKIEGSTKIHQEEGGV